jgi:small subunit ribosomal protein S16
MSTRIRLRRMGSKKRPFFRVVVADQRSPRDGRFIENIGKYHPLADPSVIDIDQDRALHWLRMGAQPSNQVRILMQKIGIWEEFAKERPSAAAATTKDRTPKERVSKKAKQKAGSDESDVSAEAATPPAAQVPESPEPAVPEPEATEPQTTEPETTAPETVEPPATEAESIDAGSPEPEIAEASAAEAVEAAPEAAPAEEGDRSE